MDAQVDVTMSRWFSQKWQEQNPKESERVRMIMKNRSVDEFAICINTLVAESFDLRPFAPRSAEWVDDVVVVVEEKDTKVAFDYQGAGHMCYIDNRDQLSTTTLWGLELSRAHD